MTTQIKIRHDIFKISLLSVGREAMKIHLDKRSEGFQYIWGEYKKKRKKGKTPQEWAFENFIYVYFL